MTINTRAKEMEHTGGQRRSYRIERKFDNARTAEDMIRSLLRAHS